MANISEDSVAYGMRAYTSTYMTTYIYTFMPIYLYKYRYTDIRPHVLTQTQRTRREDERTRQVQRCGYNALKRGVRSPKRTFFCMRRLFWSLQ